MPRLDPYDVVGVRDALDVEGYAYCGSDDPDFDLLDWSQRLGTPVPQHGSCILWRVESLPEFDEQHSSKSNSELEPHTEAYESPDIPPRFVALFCVRPASCGGGVLRLADLCGWWRTAAAELRREATDRVWTFSANETLNQLGLAESAQHPVVQVREDALIFRFNARAMTNGESTPSPLRSSIKEYAERHAVEVRMAAGSVFVWDNHRYVHARTAYIDRERLLHRTWIAR